jgi:hypothetical protein
MTNARDPLGDLRIAAPCEASWEGMAGDERVRHCTLCRLNVYNFAEMTRGEIQDLLVRTEGRVCARLYRRADGTLLTRDCPSGLRALRRRASRAAAAVMTAMLSLASLACGGATWRKLRPPAAGSRVEVQVEQVATEQRAALSGVVRDWTGSPLPGVSVVLRDEAALCEELTSVTDVNGQFRLAIATDGIYRMDVTLAGFEPAAMEHLQLKASEATHASVVLTIQATVGEVIIVGALAPVFDITSSETSTTFPREVIEKVPH